MATVDRAPLIARGKSIHRTPIQGGSVVAVGSDLATLTTALTGTNNDLVYTSKLPGTDGNSISVTYVVAGASTPLSVSVSGNDITVNVATDGSSVATSTAAQVAAAIAALPAAAALVNTANAASNDGTGVVTALSKTSLASGAYRVGSSSSRLHGTPYKDGFSKG